MSKKRDESITCGAVKSGGYLVRFTRLMPWLALGILALLLIWLARILLGDVEQGIRLLQTICSWPVAIVVLGGVALWRLQEPLGLWIRSVTRIKAPGIELEASQQDRMPKIEGDPRTGEITWEQWLQEVIKRFDPKELDILKALNDQQQQAVRQVIERYREAAWFEKIWGRIYGTQICLIEQLVIAAGVLPINIAEQYYSEHLNLMVQSKVTAETDPIKLYSGQEFHQNYLGFLCSAFLMRIDDNKAIVTDLGRRFLQYIQAENYRREMRLF